MRLLGSHDQLQRLKIWPSAVHVGLVIPPSVITSGEGADRQLHGPLVHIESHAYRPSRLENTGVAA